MMSRIGLNVLGLLTMLAVSAFARQQTKGDFILSGSVAPHASGTAYLYYEKDGSIRLDSADVANGKFKLEGRVEGPVFARLVFSPSSATGNRPGILNFFLEPGRVSVSSADTLRNVIVSGSKSDIDFLPVRKALMTYNAKLSLLNQEARQYQAARDSTGIRMVRSKMDKLEQDLRNDTYRKFIEQYPASPASLYALDQVAGSYLNPDDIEPLFNKLSPEVRNSKAGKDFAEKIKTAKASSQGGYLPDFSQPDTAGRLVKLSSFRGQYVLVDFWASWCLPCREENPHLVKAFNTYRNKGFTILGVSLDKNKASWLKAIQVDQLHWTQVSDLKYWDNEVAKKFDIRFVPQNILLDPSGRVVGRNLHGDELDKALAGIFK
ncbi:TlpA disulfide reductase family protein [Pedobacter deserti]|uniref:TlpA disulfide reductase family protein n=1 Tax=Pedobacter deserti TaxID=2817382 RepID=UPI00210B0F5E|nr:TlpA disulfide reductase family protein [Pedobacter sp. SYSU D00382]